MKMRRNICMILFSVLSTVTGMNCANAQEQKSDGNTNVPKVYMFKEISPENLVKIYEALGREATGKVAVKLSTGEPGGHNFLQPALIKDLVQKVKGTIVECNTAYGCGRADTENHLKAAKDHGFTAIAPVDIMDAEGEGGIIKRTELQAYKNVRKNGLIAITLNDGDELAGVRLTDGHCELLIATRNGMAIRIDENSARPLSRSARGVRAIRLRDGDEIAGMARLREGATVMTVTDRGQGRRSEISEYKLQSRGGKGKINYKVNDVKGYVCGIKVVDENDDLILISNDGVIIRIRVSDVNVMSRYASGVRVMRLMNEDSRVVTFARAEHDEDEEVAEVEKPTEEEIIEPVEEEDDEEPILEEDDAEANDEE